MSGIFLCLEVEAVPHAAPKRARSAGLPRADGREMAAIFVGGAVGTLARAALGTAWTTDATQWPWTTYWVNIVGTILLGYFATRLQERLPLSSYRRPLLGTGLCGGLTTFSTMQVEIIRMLDDGAYELATAYTVASVIGGLFAVHLASAMVRRVPVRI
jgi:CrcB protein